MHHEDSAGARDRKSSCLVTVHKGAVEHPWHGNSFFVAVDAIFFHRPLGACIQQSISNDPANSDLRSSDQKPSTSRQDPARRGVGAAGWSLTWSLGDFTAGQPSIDGDRTALALPVTSFRHYLSRFLFVRQRENRKTVTWPKNRHCALLASCICDRYGLIFQHKRTLAIRHWYIMLLLIVA